MLSCPSECLLEVWLRIHLRLRYTMVDFFSFSGPLGLNFELSTSTDCLILRKIFAAYDFRLIRIGQNWTWMNQWCARWIGHDLDSRSYGDLSIMFLFLAQAFDDGSWWDHLWSDKGSQIVVFFVAEFEASSLLVSFHLQAMLAYSVFEEDFSFHCSDSWASLDWLLLIRCCSGLLALWMT